MSELLRVYQPHELQTKQGYPMQWAEINAAVIAEAGYRCVRCGHPYRKGTHGQRGEWSLCDEQCTHMGEVRITAPYEGEPDTEPELWETEAKVPVGEVVRESGNVIEARYRILTVHHLNGDKLDCRWWNLAALCQRCHLTIQGRVKMHQTYPFEHSEWFKPFAAGYYAWSYLGEDLTREQTIERLDELLGLERVL